MQENQNIEWKESWRDEYLKWICGFANATGGKLLIGVNNKGIVTGLTDAKKLLEEIPNKVKDILGIIVDVNLKTKNVLQFLEINVEAYPYPISYKGIYHYRTGSTKQELKGPALDKFLLQRVGKRWDSVPVPYVTVTNLSKSAFEYFRKNATQSKRLDKVILQETNGLLLKKLHLTDGKYLKRAAVLLFHPDPEKFVTGAFVKIGFFETDADLLFQDDIHGDLFTQVEKTIDLLLTKYLKANISYKGINRIEEYPFPEAALREALLNAIAHKDYSSGNPIQISVYNSKIIFWNAGQLPENWTVKNLRHKHPSEPFNPDISNTFFRAGLIESWGRGTLKIMNECAKVKLPAPVFTYEATGLAIEFRGKKGAGSSQKKFVESSQKVRRKFGESLEIIVSAMKENKEITIAELAEIVGVSTRAIQKQIEKLRREKIIERVGADKGGYWKIITSSG